MLQVQDYIAEKQNEYKDHIFFQEIKKQDFFQAMTFAKDLTFWVMSFQDILRIVPPQIKSETLRKMATHLKIEDGGHNFWFLEDLEFLNKNNIEQLGARWLFSKEHEITRDFAYKIVAEALRPSTDYEKVTLLFSIESSSHVFFEEIANFVEHNNHSSDLKYFSNHHFEAEQNHTIFEDELMHNLSSISLTDDERADNIKVVDKFYREINYLFNHLYDKLLENKN